MEKKKNKERIAVIVQCRLSSSRLPKKALKTIGDKSILQWSLDAMKKVPADCYYLATDRDSESVLSEIAKKCGYEIYAGSLEDVLDRFCDVIDISGADVVVRATADNPFLFYEAATDLLSLWKEKNASSQIDYLTYRGLPHGSGIEILRASSLVEAKVTTKDPYDHEHVGPSLYNHQDRYKCVFEDAPEKYFYPDLRTTVDTATDFLRAEKIYKSVSEKRRGKGPFTCGEIISAFEKPGIKKRIIFVPSVDKGHGTGHLRRCLDLATELFADILIPENASLEQCTELVAEAKKNGLSDSQILTALPEHGNYDFIVADLFQTPESFARNLDPNASVISLDDGASDTDFADYLLDIIPSAETGRRANLVEPGFIPMPKRKKSGLNDGLKIHTAIVVLGGEDPASLSFPAATALSENGLYVTLVCSDEKFVPDMETRIKERDCANVKVCGPISNLREKLSDYDLVVTHYGFTAFEAAGAGCAVILLPTTLLHETLSKKYGFVCLSSEEIGPQGFAEALKNPSALFKKEISDSEKSLGTYINELCKGKKLLCPVCQKKMDAQDTLVARVGGRTFRRCRSCGMLYQSWTMQAEQTEYNHDYFYADYEKQYGKTYEEDFAAIKAQGVRRTGYIDMIFHHSHSAVTPTILDIGCALGAFMDAAGDAGWQVYGLDISQTAVDYVRNTLHFPALCAPFPTVAFSSEFGIETFDAVTMWYVIEHFQNLDSVLQAVSRIVKKGGVFAFSTPSASGVSGRYNTQTFFEQSPSDHYTLWEPSRADSILRKYGFKVCRIVPTGIHPERFPAAKKHGWTKENFQFKLLESASKMMKLGDTFEVYCKKIK